MTTANSQSSSLPTGPDYAVKIEVRAEREVAYQSPDHIAPLGTRHDNSRNRRFNAKLYALYSPITITLNVLDLGCSGGGFVRDCINDGCLAVGLEGSDYSQKRRRAEWAVIPEFLFTCDVTGNFEVLAELGQRPQERLLFDVVTSWELIEHIAEKDLAQVAANVQGHLKPSGLWIMSVSPNEEIKNGARLHQTVQDKPWWVARFRELGLEHLEAYVAFFNTQFVRGPKQEAAGSFHLVLSPNPSAAPPVFALTRRDRFFDWWLGSRAHGWLRKLVDI